MSMHWRRILPLLTASICLAALSIAVIEPEVYTDTGSLRLVEGVTVEYELWRGDIVEYSFEPSSSVTLLVMAYDLSPDLYSRPLLIVLKETDVPGSGTFTAGFHGVYRFVFGFPSETTDAERSYTICHHSSFPTVSGMSLIILAVMVGSPAVLHIVFFRRWQKCDVSQEQQDINNLMERRRLCASSTWLRH